MRSNKNKIEMILNQYDPRAHELMEVSQRQQYVMAMPHPFFHTTNNLWQFEILLTTFFFKRFLSNYFAKYCDKLSAKADFSDQHSSIRFNECSNSKAIRKLLLLLKYCAWITLNKHTLRLHILGGALENLFWRSSSDDLMHSFGTTAQKPNLNGPWCILIYMWSIPKMKYEMQYAAFQDREL